MASTREKNPRPFWITRVGVTCMDCGLAMVIGMGVLRGLGITDAALPLLVGCLFVYYAGFEMAMKRTPAKALMLYRMEMPDGAAPSNGRLVVRSMLRMLLGPFCMLSWGRVTLLDSFSGIRLSRTVPVLSHSREEVLRRSVR